MQISFKFEIIRGDFHDGGNADPDIPSEMTLRPSLFSIGNGPKEIADVPIMPSKEHFRHAYKYFDNDLKYADRLPDRQADKMYSKASPGFNSPDFHSSLEVVSEFYIHDGLRWKRRKNCSQISAPPSRTGLRKKRMALVDKYGFGFNMFNGERL